MWTIGDLNDEQHNPVAKHVLRRDDDSGAMLASSTLRLEGWQGDGDTFLFASRDRVGWFSHQDKYIEFSLDGTEIGRYDGPERLDKNRDVSGAALSDDNELVVGR